MRNDRDAASDPLQPALIVTYGNTSRKRRPLDRPVLVLGRVQGCDMPLMSPDVAPVHCVIVRLASGWRIRDCSGHLGTRLNGKTITEEPLADEDHLQVGPFNFKVHLPVRPVPPEPASPPAAVSTPEAAPQPEPDVERVTHSRANLVRLAQAYRNQARDALQQQADLKAELEKCVRDLSADRSDLDRDWRQLEKSAQALRVRELDLEGAEKALRERSARFEVELAERRRQLDDEQRQGWERTEAEFRRRQDEAFAELEKTRAEVADRREHLELQCDQLDAERAEIEAARNELDQARLDVDGLRSQADADHARAREFLRQAEEARLQGQQREQQFARRAAELDAFAEGLKRQQAAARPSSDSVGQIQVLRVEDDTLRQALDEARQQLDQLRLIADALHRENEELRGKLPGSGTESALLGSVASATVPRSELEASEAAYAALQMQLKRLQVERDQERSRGRERMEHLRQENELLRDRLSGPAPVPDAPEVTAALQDELRQAQAARAEETARAQALVQELRQEIDILREAACAETTVPVQTVDRARFEQQIDALAREADRLRAQLKQMHEENEILRQQALASLTVPTDAAGDDGGAAPASSHVSEEEMRQLVAHLDLLREENDQLRHDLLCHQNREIELKSRTRTIDLLEQQLASLQGELNHLQEQAQSRDQELTGLREQVAVSAEMKTIQGLRQAIHKLEGDLKDRDALIEKLSVELDAPSTNMQYSGSYERELHQFRLELERDRRRVDEQLEDLRQRQGEIENAARETEMQLSRERAALGRERNDLTRMRDEIRMDQERLERLSKNIAGTNGATVAQLRSALGQAAADAVSPSGKDRRR